MNDEIKEILQMLEAMASNDDIAFLPKQASLLLDYITNLQQEINKLTAESTEWESKCYDLQQENEDNLRCIKSLKEQLESVIKNNQELLKKWHKNNDKIVNLISENERLKVKTKEQSLLLIDYQDMEQRYEDYKSRCEDKTCDAYKSKQDLYFENKELKEDKEKALRIIDKFKENYIICFDKDLWGFVKRLEKCLNGSDSQ